MRLWLVPGVTPDRWLKVWAQRLPDDPLDVVRGGSREAVEAVLAGDVDAAVVRLPPVDPATGDPVDAPVPPGLAPATPSTRDGWAVVPLWTEDTVVVVPKEHVLTVVDQVDAADLADEPLVVPADDALGWLPPGHDADVTQAPDVATAVALVASEVGVLVLPAALARAHRDEGTTVRPVPDAPGSPLALVWRVDAEHPHAQELVGILRGRTSASSRGTATPDPEPRPASKATPPPARGRRTATGRPARTGKGRPRTR